MADYTVLDLDLKVRYKGIFDFHGLMKMVKDWIIRHQFEFHETRYKDKIDTAFGNEIEIDQVGERKISEYYQYFVDVAYHLWESREVEVVVDGKKVKRWQGRIEVRLNGRVVTDWQKRFDKTSVTKAYGKFLDRVVLRKEITLVHIDAFDIQLHNFNNEIKKFLKIEADSVW